MDVQWKAPRADGRQTGGIAASGDDDSDDAAETWEVEVELRRRRRGGRGAARVHAPRFPKASNVPPPAWMSPCQRRHRLMMQPCTDPIVIQPSSGSKQGKV